MDLIVVGIWLMFVVLSVYGMMLCLVREVSVFLSLSLLRIGG